MNPFPKAVLFVLSGVRGQNVYELTTRRHLVTGASNSLDVVIQQRFINLKSPYRVRAHNATLHSMASGDYELLIPASSTSPTVSVPIRFETKPTLVGGIHGSSQGPAQYELIGSGHGWTARLEINETLHRRDVPSQVPVYSNRAVVQQKPPPMIGLRLANYVLYGQIINTHRRELQPQRLPNAKKE